MVKFWIDGIEVYFPYPKIYPEQLAYMSSLKSALDAHGHAVLEMPTGTGKTVALFSFIASYQLAHPNIVKLIYCTRTIQEMEKSLLELQKVISYRNKEIKKRQIQSTQTSDFDKPKEEHFLAFGLCSRRNLCIHPEVFTLADRTKIDEKCCDLTSLWRRLEYEELRDVKKREYTLDLSTSKKKPPNPSNMASVEEVPDIEEFNSQGLCGYYENVERVWNSTFLPSGVYTLERLKDFCANFTHPITHKKAPMCPYYVARRAIEMANILVLNYLYLIDPKVSDVVIPYLCTTNESKDKDLNKKAKLPIIVVFDEAHNIDNVCIEALSVDINVEILNQSYSELANLEEKVRELRERDENRLLEEYNRLLENIKDDNIVVEGYMSPVLPDHILMKAVPGSIRKAEHFIGFLKVVIGYLKQYIKVTEAKSEGPLMFIYRFENETGITGDVMRHTHMRFKSLLYTLRMTTFGDVSSLQLVTDFCALVSIYSTGFIVIVEPFPNGVTYDPLLQFSCLDASITMKHVLDTFQSVILTSGTISPLDLYPKILNFTPVLTQSLPISLDRDCLCPIIVSKGANQVQISTRYDLRNDVTILRNYGSLLIEFCKHIPDGIVCFFPSYAYMETILSHWYECGILASIMEHKLIFMETKDVVITTMALHNYRKACDVGRGALFLSICRGKVAEGIDFDRHYGRCVILIGIPFQYTLSRVLKARLDFMRSNYGILESEFITFDAIRQAAQCVGRIIRNKNDFGLMVFADARYSRLDKRSKLPLWILKNMEPANIFLSTESAVAVAKTFFRAMAQDYTPNRFIRLDQQMLDDEKNCWETVKRILRLR